MALADTAKLVVDLSLAGNFTRSLAKASGSLNKFDRDLAKTESRSFRAGQQIGTGIKRAAAVGVAGIGLLAFEVKQGLDSLVDLEKQQKQTAAAIKATGKTAGITAQEVRRLAEKYEGLNATVGDEVIQSAENLLLTFTNVRKKAFEPTLAVALDINSRLGRGPEGLAGTLRLVAKAVNDPIKGLTGLNRLGITFDKQTTKRIKGLVKQNKLQQAQGVILQELNRRFKGSFAAEGGSVAGRVAKFNDSIEDLQRTLASGLLPVVGNIADALTELFQDPEVIKGVERFGKELGDFFTKDRIKSGIAAIKDVFSTIAAVAGPAAAAVGTLVGWFNKIPADLRNILVGAFVLNKATGGLVTNILGGLKDLVVGRMNVQAASVTVVGGGVPGAPPGGLPGKGGLGGILGTALKGFGVLFAAELASEFGPVINKFGTELGQGWRDWLNSQTGINIPTISPAQLEWPFGPKNTPTILPEIFGGNGLLGGFAKTVGQTGGKSPDQRDEETKAAIQKTTDSVNRMKAAADSNNVHTTSSIDTVKTATDSTKMSVDRAKSAIDTSKAAITNRVGSASASNAAVISGATRQGSAAIVSAIWAARPVINTYNITRSTTITNRYGGGGTSATRDALHDAGGH